MSRSLIVGTNWVGDSIMSMPALQAYKRAHPDTHVAMLVKPGLVPLWELHGAVDQVLCAEESARGTFRAARTVRRERFDTAFVLPHSFRSALFPYLAGVSERIGMPGHYRDWMLTQVIEPPGREGQRHQAYEYVALMSVDPGQPLAPPRLDSSEEAVAKAESRLGSLPSPRVGLIPGAGRGPSKRWPAAHFVELGRRLANGKGCGLVVFGARGEEELCGRTACDIGDVALDLAGKTSLPEWAALLRACDVVVANDSGGMHLAAAVGTGVVALYGMTDPEKTGPLGPQCVILQESDVRSRDIGRDSREARERLASIRPEQVYDAVLDCLAKQEPGPGR